MPALTCVACASPVATGARATMVPTDVPTEREMKQEAMNTLANSRLSGRSRSVSCHGGVNGSHIPSRLGEGSCQHENPDHHQDVPVGYSGGKQIHPFRHAFSAGDENGPDSCRHKGYRDRHGVKILYGYGDDQVKQEENQQGAQCPQAGFGGGRILVVGGLVIGVRGAGRKVSCRRLPSGSDTTGKCVHSLSSSTRCFSPGSAAWRRPSACAWCRPACLR